jgi:exodeoxyribonuclease VII small subunit
MRGPLIGLAERVRHIDPNGTHRQAARSVLFIHTVTKKSKDAPDAPDLEKSLAELEKIVARLEAGDLSLDDALKQFERGVALTRQCQSALRNAEQRVEILLRQSADLSEGDVAPFSSAAEDS